jgi:hypothetical protein
LRTFHPGKDVTAAPPSGAGRLSSNPPWASPDPAGRLAAIARATPAPGGGLSLQPLVVLG